MSRFDRLGRRALLGLAVGGTAAGLLGTTSWRALATQGDHKLRILHIMSYHASWDWNRDQFEGFQEGLGDLDVEYKVFEMDTKRRSSQEWKEQVGAEAQALIESWHPDLVYTNDDNAQEYVVKRVPSNGVPFVFSGVNSDPASYGFDHRADVTGVLEHEHIIQTLHLLREIAPEVRRIAVLLDDDPTWTGVVERMKEEFRRLPALEVVGWDWLKTFDEYQRTVLDYQDKVDALAVLGVFALKDESGSNVPFETVLRWTAEHSNLPDFSFWGSRVEQGTLCAVTVSGRAQGRAAGAMAREILVAGRVPGSIPMQASLKGTPVINLSRAKRLGIKIPSGTLLKSQVLVKSAWE